MLAMLCAEGAVMLPDGNMNMEMDAGVKHTEQNLKSTSYLYGLVVCTLQAKGEAEYLPPWSMIFD